MNIEMRRINWEALGGIELEAILDCILCVYYVADMLNTCYRNVIVMLEAYLTHVTDIL